MMSAIFSAMILVGVVLGALTGRMAQVSAAALGDASRAVELVITLTGGFCMWGGLMRIAEDSGLTRALAHLASPVLKRLFKGLKTDGKAMGAISMNLAANLLGLGNAATPLGLAAMREMEKEERSGKTATNNMALFVVMNTASLQILPATTALLRAAGGAGPAAPLDILPAVWLASVLSVLSGIAAARLFGRWWR